MDQSRMLSLLGEVYGEQQAPSIQQRLHAMLASRSRNLSVLDARPLTGRDALLITYPDQLIEPGEPPLRTLTRFADDFLGGLVNAIHLLPFFPSSSDDGFSITDYLAVDPAYGDWGDIERLGGNYALMFDAVINHASVQGEWFRGFLQDRDKFLDFFIEVHGGHDLTSVVRPRTTPLITEFALAKGRRAVWTTFSADQADLNYRNPEVLLRVLDILLSYAERGARFIRLDAVGYIWKEAGTPCIHLAQAHAIVGLIRAMMEAAAPHVMLLTETNVSQGDNLRYLGSGMPEAHLAYNFALPPLVLHTFHTSQAVTLGDWAASLPQLPERTALLNVLATHDGIGLNGCRGFMTESEVVELARCIQDSGGYVSPRANADGGSDPYELNMNYMDALDAAAGGGGTEASLSRFAAAHAIMLALKGMPAIYFHSLFGSRGWPEGARASGRPRTINRQKLVLSRIRAELANPRSLRSRVFGTLAKLLTARQADPAFSPISRQQVLRAASGLFALLRGEADGSEQVLCLHNVTSQRQLFDCRLWEAGCKSGRAVDMLSARQFEIRPGAKIDMVPYEFLWLRIVHRKPDTTR